MKPEQRGRLHDYGKRRDAVWPHKQGDQSQHEAIEHGQVRSMLSGAIADDELLLELQGFCRAGAHAAGTEELCDGYEHANRQEEQIAHELHGITAGNLAGLHR